METVGTYEKEIFYFWNHVYKISFYIKHKVSDLEKTESEKVMAEKWQWWELPDFP